MCKCRKGSTIRLNARQLLILTRRHLAQARKSKQLAEVALDFWEMNGWNRGVEEDYKLHSGRAKANRANARAMLVELERRAGIAFMLNFAHPVLSAKDLYGKSFRKWTEYQKAFTNDVGISQEKWQ